MIETYYSLGAMVVKFFANFLQITRRMTGVLFPADRFCPTEKRISAQTQPGVWTPKDLADVEPHTAVDPALHRLVASRDLRRIARGFNATPRTTGSRTRPLTPADAT